MPQKRINERTGKRKFWTGSMSQPWPVSATGEQELFQGGRIRKGGGLIPQYYEFRIVHILCNTARSLSIVEMGTDFHIFIKNDNQPISKIDHANRRTRQEEIECQTDVAVMGEAVGRCSSSAVLGPSSSSLLLMGEGGGALLWAGVLRSEDDFLFNEECSREEKSGEGAGWDTGCLSCLRLSVVWL